VEPTPRNTKRLESQTEVPNKDVALRDYKPPRVSHYHYLVTGARVGSTFREFRGLGAILVMRLL
jgi:hypothetical protein